jgi:hypothetical protein
MRKELFALLCVAGFLLWGGTTANAVDITWHMLTHSSLAGHGPGADLLLGTSDDTTTGEANNCNFTTDGGCAASATVPAIGSYGYASTELDGDVTHSCLGGASGGAPCVCADLVTPCTADAECPGALCSPADCCEGGLFTLCLPCAQNDPGGDPFAPPADSYTYGGSSQFASGTVTTCQEADPVGDTDPPTDFEFKVFDMSAGEALPGIGSGCVALSSAGGPYLGTPCTGSGTFSGTISIETFLLGCTMSGGMVDNISLAGDIIDITDPDNPAPATSSCGYDSAEVKVIAGHAVEADANAKYLMIFCGDTTVPADSAIPCTRNAQAHMSWVLYTTDDASACPDNGCQ